MTTEERFDKLEARISLVEEKVYDCDTKSLQDKYELKELITKAVAEGNEKILSIINKHEERIVALEKQDGEKAKAVIKAIFATSLSWLIMGILTNLPSILGIVGK